MKQGRREAAVTGRNKLLLAESEPESRRAIHLLLLSLGYDVRAYATGAALLEDARSCEAAAMIIDRFLPDMGGAEVLMAMRQRNWSGPALLIVDSKDPSANDAAVAMGFEAAVSRPIRDLKLIDLVNRLVRPPVGGPRG